MKADDRHTYLQGYLDGFGDVVLVHDREEEQLPGFMDRWQALGIAAQVVVIQPTGGQ
jgi:hypothetical protein